MGLFWRASGVKTGAGIPCGGEDVELEDSGKFADGSETNPELWTRELGPVWCRTA